METRNILFVVGLVAVCVLLFFVIQSSADQSMYSVDVDQAVAKYNQLKDREIKMKGNVLPGTIQCKPGTDTCHFKLAKRGENIKVFHTGPKPDTFKECAEVVVTGRFANPTVFEASDLVAKCPSKYDELPGGCEERPEMAGTPQSATP